MDIVTTVSPKEPGALAVHTSKALHCAYCVGGCVRREGGREADFAPWHSPSVPALYAHPPPFQQAGVGRALHGARPHRDKAEGAQTQCWLKLLTGWKSLLSKPALPPTSFN